MDYKDKLKEYKNMLDFEHPFFKKDFKNNYKFIQQLVYNEEKQHIKDESYEWENSLFQMLEVLIQIHKSNYLVNQIMILSK